MGVRADIFEQYHSHRIDSDIIGYLEKVKLNYIRAVGLKNC
ncbi:hypothetical protein CCACVL1_10685 [Corchorus capsularis]|uniref:Uncharacterized protein n=1 Tax=Corchorus capsularis TaxID=210143 RepID=A0A1R3IQ66_COCAP|nr:hypothetical protein CCACVL1_10685 [Corchorus capsularis]